MGTMRGVHRHRDSAVEEENNPDSWQERPGQRKSGQGRHECARVQGREPMGRLQMPERTRSWGGGEGGGRENARPNAAKTGMEALPPERKPEHLGGRFAQEGTHEWTAQQTERRTRMPESLMTEGFFVKQERRAPSKVGGGRQQRGEGETSTAGGGRAGVQASMYNVHLFAPICERGIRMRTVHG